MKTYKQLNDTLDNIKYQTRPDIVVEKLYALSHEMLSTIQELEKQTKRTSKLIYKKRKKDREGIPIIQEDNVAIGYLDVDGELIFNEINSELYNFNDKFSREFYIKENKEFVSFRPKLLGLEIVHSNRLNFNEEFCVVGYVADNQVVYYDQIMQ